MVHAFNPLATCSQPIIALSAQLSGIYQVDKREGDQSINLFDQPERLGERVSLSMSLIDEKHTGTWGPGGIIVEAPSECIVMTSPTDIGSHNSSREFLMKQARLLPLLSGDQLLQRTLPGFYNEVVAFGRSENGKTLRLKGFFIKVNKRGKPIDPVIAERMRQHVKRLNLPLVKIQVQGLYDQEMFSIEEYGVWAHYKGFRYNLGSKKPELAFQAYDGDNNNFFFSFPHRNRRGSSTLCEAWRSKLEASSRNYKRI